MSSSNKIIIYSRSYPCSATKKCFNFLRLKLNTLLLSPFRNQSIETYRVPICSHGNFKSSPTCRLSPDSACGLAFPLQTLLHLPLASYAWINIGYLKQTPHPHPKLEIWFISPLILMFVLKEKHLQRKINLSLRKDFTNLLFERSGFGNKFTKLKGLLILNNTFYMGLHYYHLPCSMYYGNSLIQWN